MPDTDTLQKGFKIGDWEVLPGHGVLRRGEQEEKPEPRVMAVLLALAARDGELVTRDELIDEVWDGRPTGDEPINRCISLLRRHLGDNERPHKYIETLTRRGYRLAMDVETVESATPLDKEVIRATKARNQGRAWMVIGAIVATLLIAVFIRERTEPVSPSDIRSLAVLPFEFLSDSDDDQYLAQAFQEEVVRTLQGAPKLVVKIGRNNYPDLETREIGELLGADALLTATLQRQGDTLKVGYRITAAKDGINIAGDDFMGQLEGIFGLQERFANLILEDLLGESGQQLVSASRPASPEAYDRYMRGLAAFDRRSLGENLERAIELFEETTRLDPLFGPAYLSLAKSYALLPDYRDAPPGESHKLAIDTVKRGVAVDESIRDVSNMIYGFVYNKQREPLKAEEAYRKAIKADVVDSTAFNWYARMLASVGRSDKALEQALQAQRLDPSSSVINTLVATMYMWVGDLDNAVTYFERSSQLGVGSLYDYFGYALMLMRQNKLQEAIELARTGATFNDGTSNWVEPLFAALEDESQRDAAIAALDEAAQAGQVDQRLNMALRVFLDDVDGAMLIAKELAGPGMHRPMDLLFLPELRALRQHPEFFELMEMLGVKQYWDENDCVWLDDSISCPD